MMQFIAASWDEFSVPAKRKRRLAVSLKSLTVLKKESGTLPRLKPLHNLAETN